MIGTFQGYSQWASLALEEAAWLLHFALCFNFYALRFWCDSPNSELILLFHCNFRVTSCPDTFFLTVDHDMTLAVAVRTGIVRISRATYSQEAAANQSLLLHTGIGTQVLSPSMINADFNSIGQLGSNLEIRENLGRPK